ncbi:MAG TPA: hypothetical protein PLW86_06250 [Rhodocyclaceae bacterium]|nr:hypothetical protein [Rhodocyclaceae bacterium]
MERPRPFNWGLLLLGLLLISMLPFSFICGSGNVGCLESGRIDGYPRWYLLSVVSPFVMAGFALVARALRLPMLALFAGMGTALSLAVVLAAVLLVESANACNPASLGLRYVVYREWLPVSCGPWVTLGGALLDSLCLGLALEAWRKGVLQAPWQERLKPWVTGLILVPLAPLLLLAVPLLLFGIGNDVAGEFWRRFKASLRR